MDVYYTSVISVKLNGAPLAKDLGDELLGCRIEASVAAPSMFELRFNDERGELARKFTLKPGIPVVLTPVVDGKTGKAMLTGEVVAVERDQDVAGERTLTLRGYDKGHRLTRRRQVMGYKNKRASDIVRQLAKEHGIPIGTVDRTTTVYDLATQPNTTDWEFLTRLAVENGVFLYVNGAGKLQFTNQRAASSAPRGTTSSTSPFVLTLNSARVQSAWIDVTSADLAKQVEVRGWDVTRKKALQGRAPVTKAKTATIGMTPAQVGTTLRSDVVSHVRWPYTTSSQAKKVAKALAEDMGNSFAELEVTLVGTPELMAGVPVSLADGGHPFEGKYTVSSVRHVFSSGARYTTTIEVAGHEDRTLYGLAAGTATGPPTMPGVATALVEDVKDPKRQGRVKLRFPWLSDTYVSDWCRVAQAGGTSGGGLDLPNAKDEVLVAFDRGSLEQPYVIAGLYNGRDQVPKLRDGAPPYPAQPNGTMAWRTVGSRSEHRLELHDGPAVRGVRLVTGTGGQLVRLDELTRTTTVASTGIVEIGAGPSAGGPAPTPIGLTMTPAGTTIRGPVTIEGPVTIVGALSVEGATNLAGALGVEGATNLAGAVTVEAAANLTGNLSVEGAVELAGVLAVGGVITAAGVAAPIIP